MQIRSLARTHNTRFRLGLGLAALAVATSLAVTATAAAKTSSSAGVKLSLVAYSTPASAYAQLIPAFAATPAGSGVSFSQSFGASGDQARAVANGQPADVVNFALAPDMATLVSSRLVSSHWSSDPYHGMVTDSVTVFVVRKGNPKKIHTWADLLKKGVQVLNPNPFTSGGARWNVLAAYGAQIKQGRTPAQAVTYLQQLYKHVVVQDKSARDALNTFLSGKGDVMLGYESEAIAAKLKNSPVDYVVPAQTILIENPVAVTSSSSNPTQSKAFVSFLRSTQAQTIWAHWGYRPVVASVFKAFSKTFPKPNGLFNIGYLGGWTKVNSKFFDPSSGIMAKIEQHL